MSENEKTALDGESRCESLLRKYHGHVLQLLEAEDLVSREYGALLVAENGCVLATREVLSKLEMLLNDPDWLVRLAAVDVVSILGPACDNPGIMLRLKERDADERPEISSAAHEVLSTIVPFSLAVDKLTTWSMEMAEEARAVALERILRHVQQISRSIGHASGWPFFFHAARRELETMPSVCFHVPEPTRHYRFRVNHRGIVTHVASTGSAYFTNKAAGDPYYHDYSHHQPSADFHATTSAVSEIAAPVHGSNDLLGVVAFEKNEDGAFHALHLEEVTSCLKRCAIDYLILDAVKQGSFVWHPAQSKDRWSIGNLAKSLCQKISHAVQPADRACWCTLWEIKDNRTTMQFTVRATSGYHSDYSPRQVRKTRFLERAMRTVQYLGPEESRKMEKLLDDGPAPHRFIAPICIGEAHERRLMLVIYVTGYQSESRCADAGYSPVRIDENNLRNLADKMSECLDSFQKLRSALAIKELRSNAIKAKHFDRVEAFCSDVLDAKVVVLVRNPSEQYDQMGIGRTLRQAAKQTGSVIFTKVIGDQVICGRDDDNCRGAKRIGGWSPLGRDSIEFEDDSDAYCLGIANELGHEFVLCTKYEDKYRTFSQWDEELLRLLGNECRNLLPDWQALHNFRRSSNSACGILEQIHPILATTSVSDLVDGLMECTKKQLSWKIGVFVKKEHNGWTEWPLKASTVDGSGGIDLEFGLANRKLITRRNVAAAPFYVWIDHQLVQGCMVVTSKSDWDSVGASLVIQISQKLIAILGKRNHFENESSEDAKMPFVSELNPDFTVGNLDCVPHENEFEIAPAAQFRGKSYNTDLRDYGAKWNERQKTLYVPLYFGCYPISQCLMHAPALSREHPEAEQTEYAAQLANEEACRRLGIIVSTWALHLDRALLVQPDRVSSRKHKDLEIWEVKSWKPRRIRPASEEDSQQYEPCPQI